MALRQVSAERLQEWLSKGEPVTVLDVRDDEARAEWSIPGSLHVDLSDDPRDLSKVDLAALPRDRPVVAVCYRGNSSRFVAMGLATLGLDAYSLEGGMLGWSLAWNVAETRLASGTTIVQVRRTGKGCLSYVVGSGSECAVVDASLPPEVYLSVARARGWRIVAALDTHVHADHLSRTRALAEAVGVQPALPLNRRVRYPCKALRDGDVVRAGRAELRLLSTPGHTAESACYHVDGEALLTGDTLFVDSVGRPDLGADLKAAHERALALHASLRKLAALPPSTRVFPCHSPGPLAFDGKLHAGSLEHARGSIPLLSLSAEDFARALTQKLPPTPANHLTIIQLNEEGSLPNAPELEAGANRCAI